jgi:hypothetical protein
MNTAFRFWLNAGKGAMEVLQSAHTLPRKEARWALLNFVQASGRHDMVYGSDLKRDPNPYFVKIEMLVEPTAIASERVSFGAQPSKTSTVARFTADVGVYFCRKLEDARKKGQAQVRRDLHDFLQQGGRRESDAEGGFLFDHYPQQVRLTLIVTTDGWDGQVHFLENFPAVDLIELPPPPEPEPEIEPRIRSGSSSNLLRRQTV